MNFNTYTTSLYIIISLLSLSCSTAPDFERDNESDPSGSNFIPSPPEISNNSYEIKTNGDIELNWVDKSNYEDGYIVLKSFGTDTVFNEIAILDKNSTSFLDTSETVIKPLTYKVISFKDSIVSDPLLLEIDFGKYSEFEYQVNNYSNRIFLEWKNYSKINTLPLIEYSFNKVDWFTSDTLDSNDNQYILDFSNLEEFNIFIRLSSLFLNFKDDYQVLNSIETSNLNIHVPSTFDVQVIFEDEVNFTWSTNLDFVTGYKIIHRIPGEQPLYNKEYIIDKGESSFQTLIKGSKLEHEFRFFALKNSTQSLPVTYDRYIFAYIGEEGLGVQQLASDAIQLTWNKVLYARELEIERSINSNTDFNLLSTLSGTATNFNDYDLDRNNTYSYRLKSKTHSGSSITIGHTETLTLENIIGLSDHHILTDGLQTTDQFFYIKENSDQLFLERRDIETDNVINRTLTNFDGIDKIQISPNNEFIAVFGVKRSNDINTWSIEVYKNSESMPHVASFKNISVGIDAFTFTHDSKRILKLDYDYQKKITYSKLLNIENQTIDTTYELSKNCLESIIRHPTDKKYILDCSNSYEILDINDFKLHTLYDTPTGNAEDEFIVGNSVYFSTSENSIVKVNLDTFEVEIIESESTEFLTIIPDKNQFLLRDNGELKILNELDNKIYSVNTDFLDNKSIRSAIYNEKTNRVIIQTFNDTIEVLSFIDKWSIIDN